MSVVTTPGFSPDLKVKGSSEGCFFDDAPGSIPVLRNTKCKTDVQDCGFSRPGVFRLSMIIVRNSFFGVVLEIWTPPQGTAYQTAHAIL